MNFKEEIKEIVANNKDENLIVDAIRIRVAELLDKNPELLFSYMYRLDVSEATIKASLNKTNPNPPDKSLAIIIWERQKKRIAFKKQFKVDPIAGWEF